MGWIDDLRGHVVGLDTTPVIYYIERKKPYIDMLRPFFQAVDNGDITLVTSIVTLLEVLVHPFRYGDTELVSKYRETLFNTDGLLTVQLSQEIAEEAARLRAMHTIRTPDAIQMATAINAGATFFLTNDTGFPTSTKINVLVLDKLLPEGES